MSWDNGKGSEGSEGGWWKAGNHKEERILFPVFLFLNLYQILYPPIIF